jgi:hypothetical protein
MTEKRFTIIDGIKKGTHSGIWDNQKQNNQRIGDELWVGEVVAMLNEGVMIVEENEQLKQQNKELKSDNDIKFWKHQFMRRYNASQIILHEISRAIDEGYEVSSEFQKYLNELKARDSENREKMERLGI